MAATARMATYGLIRSLWPKAALVEQIYKGSPILGLVTKDTDFGEEVRYVSIGTSPPQGIAAGYGAAKASKTASTSEAFQVRTTSYYGSFSLGGDLFRRYKHTGNKALLVNPMARDSKGLMNQIKNDFSSFIHGNGGGSLGRIASTSTLASNVITLDKGADRRRIVRGMTLVASTSDGTSGSVLVGEVTVAAVGGTPTAPTVTIDQSTWSGAISGLTTTSYLFRKGAVGSGAGGDGVMDGFDAWCPSHTGSPAAFKSVTRTNAPDQLAGNCLVATTKSPRQRIMEASQIGADTGAQSGKLIYNMSTRNWVDLYNELSNANALQMTKAPSAPIGKLNVGVEYDAIRMIGAGGPIDVIADPWAPDAVERLLDLDTWTLASCGPLVDWDDGATPDSPMLEDAADAREIRAVSDIAFICTNPWANVRVAVTA
jgi:hypothetical protein